MRITLIIGVLLIALSIVAQPVNDECENAIEFTSIGSQEMWWCSNDRQFRISDATPSDSEDPTCHPDTTKILKDVWFRFTPLEDNITFVFSFDSAVYDTDKDPFPEGTRLQLFTISNYSGNCQDRTLQGCKFYGDGSSLRHRLTDLTPDDTYYIRVATPIDSLLSQNANDTVGNFHFCLFSEVPEVNNIPCNDFSISASSDTLIDYGGTATLSARGDSTFVGIHYTWYIEDSVICDQCSTIQVQPLRPTSYKVIASNSVQCVSGREVKVNIRIRDSERIIYVPNAFTPNGDRLNDRITIFGSQLLQSVLQLDIYDRWGNLAFRRMNFNPNDIQLGWDGSGRRQAYSGGTFVYFTRVQFIDGSTKRFQGSFHLLR